MTATTGLPARVQVAFERPRDYGWLPVPEGLARVADADLNQVLRAPVFGGQHAAVGALVGSNAVFDAVVGQIDNFQGTFEDQCQARYYLDMCQIFDQQLDTDADLIVEAGVYLGGASIFLGALAASRGIPLHLIDIDPDFLWFTHERVRRTLGPHAPHIRLWRGDIPSYVQEVLENGPYHRLMMQHDASHDFNIVVRDLASLYYVRDIVQGVCIQDTNLRGKPKYLNYVDFAVRAVFGDHATTQPIGARFNAIDHPHAMRPDRWFGNYFLESEPEGLYIPFAQNSFSYPHPDITLEDFQRLGPAAPPK